MGPMRKHLGMVKTRWRDKDSTATKRREALRKEENRAARRESETDAVESFLSAPAASAPKAYLHQVSSSHREIIHVTAPPKKGKYKPKPAPAAFKGNPFALLTTTGAKRAADAADTADAPATSAAVAAVSSPTDAVDALSAPSAGDAVSSKKRRKRSHAAGGLGATTAVDAE